MFTHKRKDTKIYWASRKPYNLITENQFEIIGIKQTSNFAKKQAKLFDCYK